MTNFFYKAINSETHSEVSGNIDADSPREVREHVRALGLLPIMVEESKSLQTEGSSCEISAPSKKNNYSKIKPFSYSDKIYFFSQLQIMYSAGLPMTKALETLSDHAPKYKIKVVAKEIELQIRNGKTFTESLKNFTNVIGDTAVGLCMVAEASGQLDDVLKQIVEALKKKKKTKSKFVIISIYPALVIFGCIVLFFLCGLYILPKLVASYNISIVDLPEPLVLMMMFCEKCKTYWYICLALIFGLIKLWIYIFDMTLVRYVLDKIFITLPVVKDCIKYLNLSPFFAVLALAYDGGLPIPSAIEMATHSISNIHMKKQVKKVVSFLAKGETLSEAFIKTDFLPPTFNMLIVTGENSGELSNMFRQISENIDSSIDDVIAKLLEILKIAVLIIAGGALLIIFYFLKDAINIPFMMF